MSQNIAGLLRAERDTLAARLRAITAAIHALEPETAARTVVKRRRRRRSTTMQAAKKKGVKFSIVHDTLMHLLGKQKPGVSLSVDDLCRVAHNTILSDAGMRVPLVRIRKSIKNMAERHKVAITRDANGNAFITLNAQ